MLAKSETIVVFSGIKLYCVLSGKVKLLLLLKVWRCSLLRESLEHVFYTRCVPFVKNFKKVTKEKGWYEKYIMIYGHNPVSYRYKNNNEVMKCIHYFQPLQGCLQTQFLPGSSCINTAI